MASCSRRVSEVRILCWTRTFAAKAAAHDGSSRAARPSRDRHALALCLDGDRLAGAGNRRTVEERLASRIQKKTGTRTAQDGCLSPGPAAIISRFPTLFARQSIARVGGNYGRHYA